LLNHGLYAFAVRFGLKLALRIKSFTGAAQGKLLGAHPAVQVVEQRCQMA
jgi:hypothetical protein